MAQDERDSVGQSDKAEEINDKYLLTFAALAALINRTPQRRVYITSLDLAQAGELALQTRAYADGLILTVTDPPEPKPSPLAVSPIGGD